MKSLFSFFSSIKLTLFLLGFSVLLVFFGTLDQVHYGIYFTQQKYFEHVFTVWQYPAQWLYGDQLDWLHVPMPGGYLIGPLLILNLACAHFRYFRPSLAKIGIPFIHAGIVLLLFGQLWTQLKQVEYFMWLAEGEQNNFVEAFHKDEFVIIDRTDPTKQAIVSWDATALSERSAILQNERLPFSVEVLWFARNAAIFPRPPHAGDSFPEMPFDKGIGQERDLVALPQKPTYADGERNATSAIVRLRSQDGPVGTWLVSNIFRQTMPMREEFPTQTFSYNGRTYEIALRFTRHYLPATIQLLDFKHDRYPGTDIPFNFSSSVRILEPDSGKRDTLIYMNHPLRYDGLTFYQASFANNDTMSMFQVVRNPARWIPYIATVITSFGLVLQFIVSLFVHARRKKDPSK